MLSPMKRTGLILVATFGLLMAYDLFAMMTGWGATISQTVAEWIRESPVVAVFIGLAVGHLAWPLWRAAEGKKMESKPPSPNDVLTVEERVEALETALRVFSQEQNRLRNDVDRLNMLSERVAKLQQTVLPIEVIGGARQS